MSLRRAAGPLRDGLRRLLRHHDLIVFEKALLSSIPPLAPSFALAAHEGFSSEVRKVNDAFDRGFSEERLRARFEHGLRFFVLREEGRAVATTWVVREGERFIDEAGVGVVAGNGVLSLRDVFVSASERGKGRSPSSSTPCSPGSRARSRCGRWWTKAIALRGAPTSATASTPPAASKSFTCSAS